MGFLELRDVRGSLLNKKDKTLNSCEVTHAQEKQCSVARITRTLDTDEPCVLFASSIFLGVNVEAAGAFTSSKMLFTMKKDDKRSFARETRRPAVTTANNEQQADSHFSTP